MQRITRKLMILAFVLPAVFVDFNGCWRPITGALSQVGIDVENDDDSISVSFWGDHHYDDD